MQKKDVIYIDVEDDITAIIGKVKNAQEKIVALVPPKRIGVLQSSVNLKLLARAANNADKRLVLITHNAALTSLAASAEIPVAKNLQSRPEVPKPALAAEDDEDVIDGEQLPVGEHARMTEPADDSSEDEAVGTIEDLDIDGEPEPVKPKKAAGVGAAGAAAAAAAKAKKGIKVPDFGSFRKKMAYGIAGGVLLILFLVWAFVFAPHATVVVSAKTTGQALATPVTLGTDLASDPDKATIKSIEQTDKETQTVDFDATGSKDVGDKATGTVTFSTNSITLLGATIPAGTHLTTPDGLVFITTQNVTFTLSNYNGASTGITAAASGTQYNGASGSVSGAPSGVSARITDTTAGGTSKVVKVVQQSDVEAAKAQLAQQNQDDAKNKVKAKFSSSDIVIDSSFTPSGGDPQVSPAVGEVATDGKAKLTVEINYTMTGIAKDELDSYLSTAFNNTLSNKSQQRVYDNGLSAVKFSDFKAGDQGKPDTATLNTTAQVGPQINDDTIKDLAKGKRAGEVIGDIKAIDGVSDVEVKSSPFWVSGVPDDVKKISVEFKLLKNG